MLRHLAMTISFCLLAARSIFVKICRSDNLEQFQLLLQVGQEGNKQSWIRRGSIPANIPASAGAARRPCPPRPLSSRRSIDLFELSSLLTVD